MSNAQSHRKEDHQMARFVFGEEQSALEREQVLQSFVKVEDWFLENARREARAGAKIIAWPETSVMVPDTHEYGFPQRAGDLFAWLCVAGFLSAIAWRIALTPQMK